MLKMCVCFLLGMFGLVLSILMCSLFFISCVCIFIVVLGGENLVVFFIMLNIVCLISVGCI